MERAAFFFLLGVCPLLALGGETAYKSPSGVSSSSSGSSSNSVGATAREGEVTFGGVQSGFWADEHPGYAVQTGYEGYLVPTESLSIKDIIKSAGYLAALPVLGKFALKLVVKVGIALLGLTAVLSIGVILTYLLCAFTPVCKLTFHHKFDKWHKWDRSLIPSDSLESAADFVSSALAKYGDLTKKSPK